MARDLLGRCDPNMPHPESALRASAPADGRAGREPDPDGGARLAGSGLFDAVPPAGADRGAGPVSRVGPAAEPVDRQHRHQVPGDGEWQARKHGPSRRRQWRKVHLALDAGTEDVRAVEFTSSRQGDSPLLPELLAQIPPEEVIGTVTADGAYDTRRCRVTHITVAHCDAVGRGHPRHQQSRVCCVDPLSPPQYLQPYELARMPR